MMADPTGPIREVVVVVPDLPAAIDRYSDGLGYRVAGEEPVDPIRASGWNAPGLAEKVSVLMSAPNDPRPGHVRLVHDATCRPSAPLSRCGWTALEILVADAERAMARAQAAGAKVLIPPRPVGRGGLLRAAQIEGVSGELWYLTEVIGAPPGFDLPRPVADVGPVFISVLTTSQLEATRAHLERLTHGRRVTDHHLAVGVVNAVHGLAEETLHRVSTIQLSGQSAIEVDQHHWPTPMVARSEQMIAGGVLSVVVVSSCSGAARIVPIEGVTGSYIELPNDDAIA